jgi:acylphosphatase
LRGLPVLWLYLQVKTGGEVIFLPEVRQLWHIAQTSAVNRARMQIFYSGRVQGVGFRYTVKSVASGFEVTGTVRNLPDGRVELIAEGAKAQLEAFRRGIRESGLEHFIDKEDVGWGEAKNEFRGFEIVR